MSAEPDNVWILRRSAGTHLAQKGHLKNVTRLAEIREKETRERAAVEAQYAVADEPQSRVPANVAPAPVGPRPAPEFDINGISLAIEDFWDGDIDMHDGISLLDSDAEDENTADDTRQQTLFEQALAELCIRRGVEPEDDESIPHNPFDDFEEVEEEDHDEEEVERIFKLMNDSGDWAPYGNKTLFLLDLIDNLPRLRLSSAQLRMILWVMREIGGENVPTLYALRKLQKKLSQSAGVKTRHFRSSIGNLYSSNDIGELVARDWANPELGPLLQVYPEETTGTRSEVWQFDRLKELDPSLLTPMYVASETVHFYVNELARLKGGQLVIPRMWIIRNQELCADVFYVQKNDQGELVVDETVRSIRAAELRKNYEQLSTKEIFTFSADSLAYGAAMPNPLREIAGGLPLYTSFINIQSDDVSGNQSKQYNKHENINFTHANAPGRLLQCEYSVRFVSTSPHATSLEQFEAVHTMVKETHIKPVTTLHVAENRRYLCKIRVVPIQLPGDNPQQSAECSHMGPGANQMCRACDVGGTERQLETDAGYESLFTEGTPRTREETRERVEAQIRAAMTGVETTVTTMQTATGVKDRIAQHWIAQLIERARKLKKELTPEQATDELSAWLAKQTDAPYNVLLLIAGLDPHSDTPVEVLHTVLLGIVRYAWHGFYSGWDNAGVAGEKFVARLQSTDTRGLSSAPIRAAYIAQYKNNLIGKHYKTLMQTLAFHIHGLASPELFHVVRCIGALGAVLWIPEIDDLEVYLNDLQILIDNVLDAFTSMDPRKITQKQKLHVLLHLVRDIRRFGPAIRFSTEVFEAFNSVFRMSSVLSNRQAPSRDIAQKLASIERVKHIASGGYWSTNSWVNFTRAGTIRLPGKAKQISIQWKDALSSQCAGEKPLEEDWIHATDIVVISGDRCSVGSWVCIVQSNDQIAYGRVVECIVPAASKDDSARICVERFRLGTSRHAVLDMPFLARLEPREFLVARPEQLQFVFNVQHDCNSGTCQAAVTDADVRQEREAVMKRLLTVTHDDNGRYIINTHALHNAHLLRRTLPRHLTVPQRVHADADRLAFHITVAAALRVVQGDARIKKKQKRDEKKAQATSEMANTVLRATPTESHPAGPSAPLESTTGSNVLPSGDDAMEVDG
ncbi:hypothetical protein EXIGLDRAFT_807538 [Exidia glandulosa HHB12029]|uniref:Uncharacterized protein n=1 Tax=Exidia glandulosa HHB12029 TaxID=1314781 RepID=A0A165D8Q8_EXIGL|nr:hypothetical protein EXIGLDRAFT_807538 [Exidia glandulosa HHB12029]